MKKKDFVKRERHLLEKQRETRIYRERDSKGHRMQRNKEMEREAGSRDRPKERQRQ